MRSAPTPPTGTANRPPPVPRPWPVEHAESPRIAELARRPGRVEDFWRGVTAEGTPLVEPDPAGSPDHAVVTFLWRGGPHTRAVLALPNKIADPRLWQRNLMRRLPGTDVWHWSIRMRRDWRASYALCVDDRPGQDERSTDDAEYLRRLRGQPRQDPLCRRSLPRRWGGEPLSVVELPDAPDAADWRPRGELSGSVSVHRVRSAALGNERRVWVYTPAGHAPRPVGGGDELPVAVLLDGEMWQPGLGVACLLDNLIADGRLPPLIALLPESLSSTARWSELTCNDRFVEFLGDELLPWAAQRWPVTDSARRTVLAGQSLGGLMAAHAALRAPHRFGNVLSQSGSFWWPDGPDTPWLISYASTAPPVPVRFWLSAGVQEWVLLPANRRLPEVLASGGYRVDYREFNGGHDYLCWRTELADGLVELLGR